MSKIDELIKELCPNGVEYKPIGELKDKGIVKLITPSIKIKRNYYEEVGTTPIISQEVEYISGYSNVIDKNIILGEYVCFGDHTENIKYVDFAFVQGADGLKILTVERYLTDYLNVKYFYYAISNFYYRHNNYERHFKYLLQTEIPIPPLPIQREIVRILDSFTELTEELTEELTKELTKRNKQYEFYRDELLNFDNEVEFKSFRELFDVRNGLNKGKEFFGHGSPIINFTDVYTNRWLVKDSFIGTVEVTPDEIERYSAKKGDVFFTRTSETKEDIGMASTLIEDVENCVFSGFVLRARPKTDLLLPKFCAYYFSSTTVRNTIVRYASFTTRATTTGDKLSKILVPILSKEKQEKIVYVLDNFDAICSDLNIGLPAEIEARQKQYEYYRDMLLAFAEKGEIIPNRQTDRQTSNN